MRGRIVVGGMGQRVEGITWEAGRIRGIGSQQSMDIVLHDPAVSRRQAEIQNTGKNWVVRDLANHALHVTYLNGTPLGRGDNRLKLQDVLQFGGLALRVTTLEEKLPEPPPPFKQATPGNGAAVPSGNGKADHINVSGTFVRVQLSAQHSWDHALHPLPLNRHPPIPLKLP